MKSARLSFDSLARGRKRPIDDASVAWDPTGQSGDRKAGLPALDVFPAQRLDFRVDQHRGRNRLGTFPGGAGAGHVKYDDPLANMDLGGGQSDETLLGDTELTYRFVQREWVQMHAGLGFRLLADRWDTRAGFNFFYGADVYPVAPLVLSTAVDLGNLDAAFVVHARFTAGVNYRNWELLAGYDFLRVGSVNLQGPLLGLRFWF